MNLQNLTPKQVEQLMENSVEAFSNYRSINKESHKGTPTQKEIWQVAFSTGVIAALNLVDQEMRDISP